MTAASPATSVPNTATRYLSDIFEGARRCHRPLLDLREEIEALIGDGKAEETYDLRIEERAASFEMCASIAPVALRRAEDLASAMPDYVRFIPVLADDGEPELERFMRPIFEEAGISEDFIPAALAVLS